MQTHSLENPWRNQGARFGTIETGLKGALRPSLPLLRQTSGIPRSGPKFPPSKTLALLGGGYTPCEPHDGLRRMKRILLQPDFNDWRSHARTALQEGYTPEDLDLEDSTVPTNLTLGLSPREDAAIGQPILTPHVPKSFIDLAQVAAVHRDPHRWNLLYRILYRLQTNRDLLKIEIDTDVAQLQTLDHQVRRDLHKMHAFVRFRKVEPDVMDESNPFAPRPEPPSPASAAAGEASTNQEHFVAWYQPDHRILPLAAPFFVERFAPMQWTILTPDASVSWDPAARQLHWFEGLPRESAPQADELETLWRSYYASIFNPARLNPSVMRSEMPVRYWKDLPEVALLPTLITQAASRVGTMVTTQAAKPSAAPFVPTRHELPLINAALPTCKGCDLYLHATQAVPGVGPSPATAHKPAALMLVGEQPGDQEDLQGLPFVGPAGRILDKVLAELQIDRSAVYVTNAVKHFKFIQRGKLRLHQNPRMSEISACRPWLLAEIDAVRPKVVLCLGASASKSLLGGTFALMRDHGKILSTPYANQVVATIHPSAVLRARDPQTGEQLYNFLRDDLALAFHAALHGTSVQPAVTSV